jgi:hypothetical protein
MRSCCSERLPMAGGAAFRHDLLERAAVVPSAARCGERWIGGLEPESMNEATAIWLAEEMGISGERFGASGQRRGRGKRLDAVVRGIPVFLRSRTAGLR